MHAVTYPQQKVAAFIADNFIPVRIHTDAHPELTEKYRVPWTPTVLVLSADGTEHYRDTGFLPPEDFLARLNLALGTAAFEERDFATAAKHFQTVVDQFGSSEAVPKALFFLGVCKNRMPGGKMDDRRAIWKRILDQQPKSDRAKKASFAFEEARLAGARHALWHTITCS